jgi:predicted nucleotidyltransferase
MELMSTSPAGVAVLPPAALRIAEAIRAVAEAEPQLAGLYLFGSHATGEAHPASDVDLGALFASRVGIWELLGLQTRLEEALGTDVDLVDAGTASPYLALDIVRGERLYCADIDACDDFELYVLRRAADLAPFERQRRRMLLGFGAEETEGS